jgi:hypothetical protein
MDDRLKKSQQQEKRAAKRLNARIQPRSGAGWIHKGDVSDAQFLYEMKRTDAKSITLKLEYLETISKHALQLGKIPVVHLEIGNKRFVVLAESDFEELREHQSEGDGTL